MEGIFGTHLVAAMRSEKKSREEQKSQDVMQILNICKSINVKHHINESQNLHDHLNISRKSIWQNSITIHDKKKKIHQRGYRGKIS